MSFIFSISFSSYFEFQKQTRWYLLILLLKFFFFSGNVIFNSIQYSVTSYVNEMEAPVTTLGFFPNCSCSAFSTWLLLSWPPLRFTVLCFTFVFSIGNSWTIFWKQQWDLLRPQGAWHRMLLQRCYNQRHWLPAGHSIKNTLYIIATDVCVKLIPFIQWQILL